MTIFTRKFLFKSLLPKTQASSIIWFSTISSKRSAFNIRQEGDVSLPGFLFHDFEVFGRSSFHAFRIQVPVEASLRHSEKGRLFRSSEKIVIFRQPPISLVFWGNVRIPLRTNHRYLYYMILNFRENLCHQITGVFFLQICLELHRFFDVFF